MYMQNREDDLPYDEPLLGPPILIEGDLDFSCVFQGERKTLQQVIVNTNKQPIIWLVDVEKAHLGARLLREPERPLGGMDGVVREVGWDEYLCEVLHYSSQ